MELHRLVKSLIDRASEGSYWDFKQSWHSDNADLLKDIICMANNITDNMKDGYIIFGVEDRTYKIVDVSGDDNRNNQENVIGFLSSQTWSGETVFYYCVMESCQKILLSLNLLAVRYHQTFVAIQFQNIQRNGGYKYGHYFNRGR